MVFIYVKTLYRCATIWLEKIFDSIGRVSEEYATPSCGFNEKRKSRKLKRLLCLFDYLSSSPDSRESMGIAINYVSYLWKERPISFRKNCNKCNQRE
ncbi:hypothetical protein AVEN_187109-1 [Araneus ventricosus]|uniref:Uncharacterized protein n=1 Tax=Araneus ventricosus TaxID=182803 RepID=A0A4Y2EXC9_ARAVE|nr:hypothetical protein AVEN_187109-1 [Araneus ventricosus]